MNFSKTRRINGSLHVQVYYPTETPGEYTFTNALFDNQGDPEGRGATVIEPGFLLYIPAMDAHTMLEVPGLAHRYRITSIQHKDLMYLSATIQWYEGKVIEDLPLFDSTAMCSEP